MFKESTEDVVKVSKLIPIEINTKEEEYMVEDNCLHMEQFPGGFNIVFHDGTMTFVKHQDVTYIGYERIDVII